MSSRVTCRQCGNDYVNISKHWTSNPSCEWPELTDRHHEILTGVLLARGNIDRSRRTDGSNPSLRVESTNESVLNWLYDEFSPFACAVNQTSTAEENRERAVERGWDEDADYSATYRWKTRSHPEIAEYERKWYEDVPEGEENTPNQARRRAIPRHEVSRTPTTLLAWYLASNGGLVPKGTNKVQVRLAVTNIRVQGGDKRAFFEELLEPFNPRISYESGVEHSSTRIVLRDSAAFFEYIGNPPSGYGFDRKWPEAFPDREVMSVSDRGEECPVCGQSFIHLSSHWQGEDCRHPELSDRQKDTLRGLVYGGATVNVTAASKQPHVIVDSTDRGFLEWLDEELKWLKSSISRRSGGGKAETPAHWDTDQDVTEFDAVYRLQTRSHPFIEREFDWLVERRRAQLRGEMSEDAPLPSPTFVNAHSTEHIVRTMYAYRGRPPTDSSGDKRPTLACTNVRLSDDQLASLFAPYEPDIRGPESNGMKTMYLHDGDGFYNAIGSPPAESVADLWPVSYGGTAERTERYTRTAIEEPDTDSNADSDPLYDVFNE